MKRCKRCNRYLTGVSDETAELTLMVSDGSCDRTMVCNSSSETSPVTGPGVPDIESSATALSTL